MACAVRMVRVVCLLLLFPLVFDSSLTIAEKDEAEGQLESTNNEHLHDRLEAKLDRIIEDLENMRSVEIECNISMKHVSSIHDETRKIKRILTDVPDIRLVNDGEPSRMVLLEVPAEFDSCMGSFEGSLEDDMAAKLECLRKILKGFEPNTGDRKRNEPGQLTNSRGNDDDAARFADNLIKESKRSLKKPKPSLNGIRIRKEYRTLTHKERKRFHKAMKTLFKNGTIADFGRIHAITSKSAHKGIAFLPWHRIFIKKFEDALQTVDSSVTLPYWDCTIDAAMKSPKDSILWSDDYFGNMIGDVTSGLAGGWTSAAGNLQRYCGKSATLPGRHHFERLMKHCYIQNVSFPSRRSTYEYLHNEVHAWVGGDMSNVGTAAYDPLFYFMHAFFDYMWEEFRRHQRKDCFVDPTKDFPSQSSSNTVKPL